MYVCLQTLLAFITFWSATCYFAKHLISAHFLMSSRKWLWTCSQHHRKNGSFQYHSAIFILSGTYIIQILLDHCSNFSFLSPTKHCQIWLLIFPWSSSAISYNIPTVYLSIQYKLAVLLQSACVSSLSSAMCCSSFHNVSLHPFLSIGIHPFYRLYSGS